MGYMEEYTGLVLISVDCVLFITHLHDLITLPTSFPVLNLSIDSLTYDSKLIIVFTIMLTCPGNVHPLTTHFYMVHLGYTLFFLFLL